MFGGGGKTHKLQIIFALCGKQVIKMKYYLYHYIFHLQIKKPEYIFKIATYQTSHSW